MSVERTPEQEARAERAKRSFDALSVREPQTEIYEGVTFAKDHVVGSERVIPLFKNELILAPGHLDVLFKLGVIQKEELFKVSQTPLLEGVQSGMNSTVTFRDELALDGRQKTMELQKLETSSLARLTCQKSYNEKP